MATDWDSYILNPTLGADIPASLAGSQIDDPRPPAPETPRDRRLREIGTLFFPARPLSRYA